MDFVHCLNQYREQLSRYIKKHNLKALVIGESGGLDSAVNTIICKKVCDDLNIPLYGYFIQIESNKDEEKQRAENIGKLFCSHFESVDLTKEYISLRNVFENGYEIIDPTFADKIRRGNIKARLRMAYLRDKAHHFNGICIDNSNKTEWELGFFTKNDEMDLSILLDMWKTTEYSFAKFLINVIDTKEGKEALQACIDAVPTDGLGITNSDLEQMGCESYNEVDDILQTLMPLYQEDSRCNEEFTKAYQRLENKYDKSKVHAVWSRHINSEFKRKGRKNLITSLYFC